MLLRLAVGIALIYLGVAPLFGAIGEPIAVARELIEAAAGTFLLAGLWTPVMATLISLDELWIAFSLYGPQTDRRWIHIFLAVVTAGVAMLGPGAWSIDARLFGRKLFKMGDRPRESKLSH